MPLCQCPQPQYRELLGVVNQFGRGERLGVDQDGAVGGQALLVALWERGRDEDEERDWVGGVGARGGGVEELVG